MCGTECFTSRRVPTTLRCSNLDELLEILRWKGPIPPPPPGVCNDAAERPGPFHSLVDEARTSSSLVTSATT